MAYRGVLSSATDAAARLRHGARRTLRPRLPHLPGGRRLAARLHLGERGQSLVEFALILPVLLLLALTALDFGRIYLGWINLQNMSRIAANFAANNPDAWLAPGDTTTIEQYQNQVLSDAAAINCVLDPTTPADPTFTDVDGNGRFTDIGDQVTVALTCKFQVITPVVSNIVGGVVDVSASAVFPITTAMMATGGGSSGGGGGCTAPSAAIYANPTTGAAPLVVEFRDASGGGAGESWLWNFGDTKMSTNQDPGDHTYAAEGVYVVTLSVTNACGTVTTEPGTTITVGGAEPEPLCMVPEFVAKGGTWRSAAQSVWNAAGFTTTVQGPLTDSRGHDYKIKSQDLTGATQVPCDSTIVVGA